MALQDYRSRDLAGAAYMARILGSSGPEEDRPSLLELAAEGPEIVLPLDAELAAAIREDFGVLCDPALALIDEPF